MDRHHHHSLSGTTHGLSQDSHGQPLFQSPTFEHQGYAPYTMGPSNRFEAITPIYYPSPGHRHAAHERIRKKDIRAFQACEPCRKRKQKCDERHPCSSCEESKLSCGYRKITPAKIDKNMDNVVSVLEEIKKSRREMRRDVDSRLNALDCCLNGLEQQRFKSSLDVSSEPPEHTERALKRRRGLGNDATPPHRPIFLWPSVQILFQAVCVDADREYVMHAETRGSLRIHGCGESIEERDGTQPGGPVSYRRGEESLSDAPSPPETTWGHGLQAYAYPSAGTPSYHPHTEGGLKPDGTLDLDVSTVNKLWASYVKHMHAMYPFLDLSGVSRSVKRFSNHHVRNKISRTKRFIDTEHSPINAVIYLVLALGKICAHKESLPGPFEGLVANADGDLSRQFAGNLVMQESYDPRMDHPSRRASTRSYSSTYSAKDMDAIPGIAYYAKAAEILGEHGDGNDLIHAQMFLLAGLYKAQLARVQESMGRVAMAGRVLRRLTDQHGLYNDEYWMEYGNSRRQRRTGHNLLMANRQQNLIVLASWTCLDLECDILSEVPFLPSGIQDIEDFLPMPYEMDEEKTEEGLTARSDDRCETYHNISNSFTAHILLRKHLNQVRRDLYEIDCRRLSLTEVQSMLLRHGETLDEWRATLSPALQWNDNEPPPREFLRARLRAEYWGARLVIDRPFLGYALHIMPYVKSGSSVEEVVMNVQPNSLGEADIRLFKAIELMGEAAVWDACQRCIEAAMQNTVSLDGVPERLIVSNIHGTAHAQFGNMLVLSATWHTGYMRGLIDSCRFQSLFARTINFLRNLSAISPTCERDCWILEKIQSVLFGTPAIEKL